MSHLAKATTKLANVTPEIVEETLAQLVPALQNAQVGAESWLTREAKWTIGFSAWNPRGYQGRCVIGLVEDAQGNLTFVYDTDYAAVAAEFQKQVVAQYTALALQVAMLRCGWNSVEQATVQSGRTLVKGVRA